MHRTVTYDRDAGRYRFWIGQREVSREEWHEAWNHERNRRRD